MTFTLAAIGDPFIPGWDQLRPFIADLVLIGTIITILLAPFFTRRSNYMCAGIALAGVILALVSMLAVGMGPEIVGQHFRGLLVADHFAMLWKAMLLVFTAGVILMWFSTTAPEMHEGDGPEFFTLLIGATLGMSLMASTSNLLMLVLVVEMASLPSYVLAGFRKTDRIGAEASLKYVLFGSATSAIMIFGVSLLYGLYGTLDIGVLAREMAVAGTTGSSLLIVGIGGLIVGLGFKVSAVPFHFWCPDVFEGAGIDVSAFLSVASKGAALVLMLRVVMLIADGLGYQSAPGMSLAALAIVIGVLGAITATVGNTAAFVQTNIKRLLAYSSIAHAGYMLCALSLLVRHNSQIASPSGNMLVIDAASALLLYLAVYLFMNLGAFTVAGLIYRQTGSEQIDDYAAMGRRAPVLALCMGACMFSLVGLPPFAGFIAKLKLMYVLGDNGGSWWSLVVVIGVNTILSLYYYLRVVKVMYLSPSDAGPVRAHPLGLAVSTASAIMLVVMLIGFGPLNRLTGDHGRIYVGTPEAPAAVADTR